MQHKFKIYVKIFIAETKNECIRDQKLDFVCDQNIKSQIQHIQEKIFLNLLKNVETKKKVEL